MFCFVWFYLISFFLVRAFLFTSTTIVVDFFLSIREVYSVEKILLRPMHKRWMSEQNENNADGKIYKWHRSGSFIDDIRVETL